MLESIINNLTKQQKIDLYIRGIPSQLISSWRIGKRRPTYAQCVSLCAVTGYDLPKLLTEVALNDAKPEDREKFEHLLNEIAD